MAIFTPISYFYIGLKCPKHAMKCKAFEEWGLNQLGEQNLTSLLQSLLSSVDLWHLSPLEPSSHLRVHSHPSPCSADWLLCGTKRTLCRDKRGLLVVLACVGHCLWSKDKQAASLWPSGLQFLFCPGLISQRVSLLSFASFLLSCSLTLSFSPSIHPPVVGGMLLKEGNLMATY